MSFALPNAEANFKISTAASRRGWRSNTVMLHCITELQLVDAVLLLMTISKTVIEIPPPQKKKFKNSAPTAAKCRISNLPTSESMRSERDTQSYGRAITEIQDCKARLLLRSEFPTGSNKIQLFVSETPLGFNYSQLHFLLAFFWDETYYLKYPSSAQGYDTLCWC